MKKYIEFEHPPEQVAGVFCEERVGVGPERRINPFKIRRVEGRLNFEIDDTAGFAEAEKCGVANMLELARDYGLIFWFSPPGGEYVEGRIVVARVAKVENDDIALECRGLVAKETPEAMMEMAKRIIDEGGMSMDGIESADDLRSQPVGINLDGEDWIDFGNRMLGMEVVWEAIRSGADVRNKKEIEIKVSEVMGEIGRRGVGTSKEWWLEYMMAQRGYLLNAMGNHGGSALMMKDWLGIFNLQYSRGTMVTMETPGAKRCSKCLAWYVGDKCPFC